MRTSSQAPRNANYLSGGVGNRISYKTGDKTFNFNLDIPIISCISRPENNRQFKIDDMTFVGIVKNLSSNPEVVLPDKNFYVKVDGTQYVGDP